MRVLVLGGSGFIGPRVMRRLLGRGHQVHCMDIAPDSPALADLRDRVEIVRGDITLMDDVMEAMAQSQPDRVLNLAYAIGAGEADPHPNVRLNILGMDNCFEAARILGIRRVVYASSLAVYGQQRLHGKRAVVEDDARLGTSLYAVSKIFNEHPGRLVQPRLRDGHYGRASRKHHRPGQGAWLDGPRTVPGAPGPRRARPLPVSRTR